MYFKTFRDTDCCILRYKGNKICAHVKHTMIGKHFFIFIYLKCLALSYAKICVRPLRYVELVSNLDDPKKGLISLNDQY